MRNIPELLASDKGQAWLTVLIIILVGTGAFALGRLSASGPVKESRVEQDQWLPEAVPETMPVVTEPVSAEPVPVMDASTAGQFVASKNGEAYHYPWCPGAKQISEQNKIWFGSHEAAVAAGYRKAANCPGL